MGEQRGGETDTGITGVVDVVEPLDERVAVDEIEALARAPTHVGSNEVDAVCVPADRGIQLHGRRGRVSLDTRGRGRQGRR